MKTQEKTVARTDLSGWMLVAIEALNAARDGGAVTINAPGCEPVRVARLTKTGYAVGSTVGTRAKASRRIQDALDGASGPAVITIVTP